MSRGSSPAGELPAASGWEPFADGLQFHAQRCVHSHSPIASCRACETACPRAAWRLTEDGLDFDPDACVGCGLCVPACPESAIRSIPAPAALPVGEKTWLLACAHSGVERPNLPCLHAVSDAELIVQWHRGCREIHAAKADCETCPHAPPQASARLPSRLERLNAALRQRQCPAMALFTLDTAAWNRSEQRQRKAMPDLARRGWLTRSITAPAKAFQTTLPPDSDSARPVLWPWQARIDPVRCTACDACARLCLHQSLRHDTQGEGSAYMSKPRHCTGCGLCVDVCAESAVTLHAWEQAPALLLWPVQEKNCAHCGVPFHACEGDAPIYCSVCRHTRHPRTDLRIIE